MSDPKLPLPPETFNDEQEDESTQAQSVAQEALGRATSGVGDIESGKTRAGKDSADAQDLIDHMKQMETSGRIDMSAFAGERNDDEEEGRYGSAAEED